MGKLARVREASVRVAKVQRRVWLLQTFLLPAVTIGGIGTAIAVGAWAWRKRAASTRRHDEIATPVEVRLNSAPSGNSSV